MPTTAKVKSKRRIGPNDTRRRARKASRKAGAATRLSPAAALAAFARRIVKITTANGEPLSHLPLYAPDAVSSEASFETARGIEAIAAKAEQWQ